MAETAEIKSEKEHAYMRLYQKPPEKQNLDLKELKNEVSELKSQMFNSNTLVNKIRKNQKQIHLKLAKQKEA